MGSLRAFLERGGSPTQVRDNFAGEMQRACNQNWIWLRACEIERFDHRWGSGDCRATALVGGRRSACPTNRNNAFENFCQLLRISCAFASDLWEKNRVSNWRERFADAAQILVRENGEDQRGALVAKNSAPCFSEEACGSRIMCAINDGALVPHLKPSRPVDTGKSAGNCFVVDLDRCGANGSDRHSSILLLMLTAQSNWRPIVTFTYELKWRFAFGGSRANDFFRFWSLLGRNDRNATLNDSRFFSRDLRDCLTQPLFVIEID